MTQDPETQYGAIAPANQRAALETADATSADTTHLRPTSADVARLAGVSKSAVSRAFTPGGSISIKTRDKVIEAANLIGYEPNLIPRIMMNNCSGIVAIISDHLDQFFSEILDEMVSSLQEMGMKAMVLVIQDDFGIEDAVSSAISYRVDGIIVLFAKISIDVAKKCNKMGTPIVLFSRHVSGEDICSVCSDDVGAAYEIADMFVANGRRNFAFLGGNVELSVVRDRGRGFQERIRQLGYQSKYLSGSNTFESGFANCSRLIETAQLPDAIFCANDIIAMGAIEASKKAGLKLGEEITIVGFDDIPMSSWNCFELTTFRQPRKEMIELTISTLKSKIEGKIERRNELMRCEFVERKTFVAK